MGQATSQLEPPAVADPLDGAMAGGGPDADGQADDLLSELAGAEIDRMLAAADVEPEVATLPPPPVIPPPVIPPPVAIPEPVVAAPVEPAKVEPPVPAPEPIAAAPAPADVPAPVAAADLNAVLAAAAEASTVAATSADLDLGNPIARSPFFLRPLELLNAPLEMLPDTVRDAIGKVAVVTLVNSVAVIAYVMLFRRHG